MNWKLTSIARAPDCCLYEASVPGSGKARKFVVSTPETAKICNDPLFTGIGYTRALSHSCAATLKALRSAALFDGTEHQTIVFHILRGGLNFGLRDALADAFGWNNHPSAFISAQRARKSDQPSEWFITESHYKKVHVLPESTIVFGDVVATGTSLEYALHQLTDLAVEHKAAISQLLFFTIGGPRSHEILDRMDEECRKRWKNFKGSAVVYFEGIFSMAEAKTPVQIKIDGTDLLRREALLAPEFVESQYAAPCFPLERCTIYDAGSRSFDLPEYIDDVKDYWHQVRQLAERGVTFQQLLAERMPGLTASRFGSVDLLQLASRQLQRIEGVLA